MNFLILILLPQLLAAMHGYDEGDPKDRVDKVNRELMEENERHQANIDEHMAKVYKSEEETVMQHRLASEATNARLEQLDKHLEKITSDIDSREEMVRSRIQDLEREADDVMRNMAKELEADEEEMAARMANFKQKLKF